jgi:hypothetical protein
MNLKKKTSRWAGVFALVLLSAPAAMQAQYAYTTNSDGISLTITGYSGLGGDLTIPTNINGLTVTSIGASAFFGNYTLTNLTIPASVTNLEDGAPKPHPDQRFVLFQRTLADQQFQPLLPHQCALIVRTALRNSCAGLSNNCAQNGGFLGKTRVNHWKSTTCAVGLQVANSLPTSKIFGSQLCASERRLT